MTQDELTIFRQIATNDFAENLKLCYDMEDKKFAVTLLADALGPKEANLIARVFGLNDQYYHVYEV